MKPFSFVGKLQASKSMLNRLLLLQCYSAALKINGESQADDVRHMRQAIDDLNAGDEVRVGAAGTVLRFMALRASRLPGRHVLRGSPRLFARPQTELIRILQQLGVQAELGSDFLRVEGSGWKMHGDTLLVPSDRSSQFASAVLLNSWDLPFDLYVSLGGRKVSEGYWRMSVTMAEAAGMKIDFWDGDFRVVRGQQPQATEMSAEIDMSSAFALASLAAVAGQATFLDFPGQSLQPDVAFLSIFERLGVGLSRKLASVGAASATPIPTPARTETLTIERAPRLNGVVVNLKSTPDLFPGLAVLCALAEGDSELNGAPHLVHKESDRLNRTVELIRAMGRNVEARADGIKVSGAVVRPSDAVLKFDCDQDHRLAFAAAILKFAGWKIEIQNPEVVDKSFPQFWELIDGAI